MDDAHIFCTPEQLEQELRKLLRFVLDLLGDFGLGDFYLELSTRDEEKQKYVGSDQEWADATEALRRAMVAEGLDYVLAEGGAAFYGPKISVQGHDAIGRTWQLSTIQLDFQLPQRFELEYQASDGSRQRPIMIHRALFGSIERFFGILVEHYAGAFPAWLAPVQVAAIPISADQVPYLEELAARLRDQGVRVDVDDSDDRMQRKIRDAQRAKVPFMLLAGEKDVAQHSVSFRYRDGSQRNFVPLDEAVAHVVDIIRSRDNRGPSADPVPAQAAGSGG
jgi:threonyl-tRNA synthetase